MPGIHRRSRIGILDATGFKDKPQVHYCLKCWNEAGVHSILGVRIYTPDELQELGGNVPMDADNWRQCNLCGSIYALPELRGEGDLQVESEYELSMNKFEFGNTVLQSVHESRKIDRSGLQTKSRKKKYRQELTNIKDKDVRTEIERGGKVIDYSITKGS